MEKALRQLEAYIAGMAPADRDAALKALHAFFAVLGRYKLTLTPTAVVQFFSSMAVAHAAGTMDRFWARVAAKAKEIGPHVGAVFQSL